MSKTPACQAVILDMDGLLLDTERTYLFAWQKAAHAQGHVLPAALCAELAGLHYDAVEKTIAGYCTTLDLPQFRTHSSLFWRRHVEINGIALKSGFAQLFAALTEAALPYCLATNSLDRNAEECLRLAGVAEMFPLRITRSDVREGKPAPEIFLKAAALLARDIATCWVIEDSFTGLLAGKQAGAFTVWIPPEPVENAECSALADLVLHNLAELGEIILCQDTTPL